MSKIICLVVWKNFKFRFKDLGSNNTYFPFQPIHYILSPAMVPYTFSAFVFSIWLYLLPLIRHWHFYLTACVVPVTMNNLRYCHESCCRLFKVAWTETIGSHQAHNRASLALQPAGELNICLTKYPMMKWKYMRKNIIWTGACEENIFSIKLQPAM